MKTTTRRAGWKCMLALALLMASASATFTAPAQAEDAWDTWHRTSYHYRVYNEYVDYPVLIRCSSGNTWKYWPAGKSDNIYCDDPGTGYTQGLYVKVDEEFTQVGGDSTTFNQFKCPNHETQMQRFAVKKRGSGGTAKTWLTDSSCTGKWR